MKVLYVTFIQASEKFGGGLGILQMLSSLGKLADIDYVGPEYDVNEFKKYQIKIKKKYILNQSFNGVHRIRNYLTKRISSGFYDAWTDVVDKINTKEYSFVYMDFTRQNFVAQWAKKNHLKLIIRAHNVEADYALSLYKNNRTVKNLLRKHIAKNNERDCVRYADIVIPITDYEQRRFMSLYGGDINKYPVIPICVKHFDALNILENNKEYILITGSLWFGPNADGTIWFLEKVWKKITNTVGDKYDLVVAGAKPNSKIVKLASEIKNIRLFESPEDIGPFYTGAKMYIAPIFYGAGMKVKIAEALSCGLPVIATEHALKGYEAVTKYTYKANNEMEFISVINEVDRIINTINLGPEILDAFENNYSFVSSHIKLKKIIDELCGRR